MTMPLPQRYHGASLQAELAVNEWRQRAYEWQAYAEWQRRLLATPSSPNNDNRATKVATSTPTRKRNRKPTLSSKIGWLRQRWPSDQKQYR